MTAVIERPATHAAAPERIPFRRLLGVEWSKSLDTRAARWVLAAAGALALLAVIIALVRPSDIDQNAKQYAGFVVGFMTLVLPVVVLLNVTTEWTQRTALTTFVLEPRRARVLRAKLGASLLLGIAAIVVASALVVVGLIISGAVGRDVTFSGTAAWIGLAAGVILAVLTAFGYGALLHNTAAAIVAYFLVPVAFSLLSGVMGSFGDWINPGQTSQWLTEGDWGGHTGQIIVAQLLWMLLPLVLGVRRTMRREVS